MNAFATTDVGIERNVNQDYVYAKLDDIGCLPNLFIVADGMGGHKAGDTASRYTVETLVELLKESEGKDPLATIDNNIKLVNTLLLRKAGESEEYNGMGTTLVVASIFDNTLRVANVGDSRLQETIRGWKKWYSGAKLTEKLQEPMRKRMLSQGQ